MLNKYIYIYIFDKFKNEKTPFKSSKEMTVTKRFGDFIFSIYFVLFKKKIKKERRRRE